ncbi:MAG: hypothetical protein P9E24_01220 [Candidatus Competibacter sp.]|nr:hypothetical protein [Candidatus Competibacter sp.]MDG4583372.1 hypothetical protein [Candidatus Competibacter sp.]
MSPCKPKTGITFNATESLAEWAWKYGEDAIPHRYVGGYWLYPDGSSLWRRWCVHTARSHRLIVEVTLGHAPTLTRSIA